MPPTLFLPKEVAHWIVGRPWLHVRYSSTPRLADQDWEIPIELHKTAKLGESRDLIAGIKKRARKRRDAMPVIAGGYLPKQLRATLEAEGIGYLDSWGRLHLPWPAGLVHVESDRKGMSNRRTLSSTLGVHGVRAVQAILDQPTDIQVKQLAKTVKLSLSGTHAVLKALETEGLVRTSGSGPSTKRTVVDRTRLLNWLAAQPAARRRERHIDIACYARTPHEGWLRARKALEKAGIQHALTGSAAATALGAGPTNVLISAMRIAPDVSFESAVAALAAEETDRGANMRLLRDTGMTGSANAIEHDGLLVAPLPRIYLDTLGERRGDEVAEHFREVVLGY